MDILWVLTFLHIDCPLPKNWNWNRNNDGSLFSSLRHFSKDWNPEVEKITRGFDHWLNRYQSLWSRCPHGSVQFSLASDELIHCLLWLFFQARCHSSNQSIRIRLDRRFQESQESGTCYPFPLLRLSLSSNQLRNDCITAHKRFNWSCRVPIKRWNKWNGKEPVEKLSLPLFVTCFAWMCNSSLLLLGICALLWATHGFHCADRLDVGLHIGAIPFLLTEQYSILSYLLLGWLVD